MDRLFKRQCDIYGNCVESFWYSNTGLAVRYGIVAGIFVVFVIFLLASYFHAQRRMKRGQPPLRYHRWLLRSNPNYWNQSHVYETSRPGYVPPQEFGMQPQAHAPPAYTNWDAPPLYQPPVGGTKVLANQQINHASEQDQMGMGGSSQVQQPPAAYRV